MTRPRAERMKRVRALREQGFSDEQIGQRVGLAVSTVREYFDDPNRERVMARKRRYAGKCSECAAPTYGGHGREKAPKFCAVCSSRIKGVEARGWTRESIIQVIRVWALVMGRPPRHDEWTGSSATDESVRRRHAERDPQAWPHGRAVVKVFGSWNAAIEAAGFEPLLRRRTKVAA